MLSAFQNFHAISAIISFKLKISSWKLNQNGDTPNGNQKNLFPNQNLPCSRSSLGTSRKCQVFRYRKRQEIPRGTCWESQWSL